MQAIEARKIADIANDASRTPFQDRLASLMLLIRRRAELGKYRMIVIPAILTYREELIGALRDLGYKVRACETPPPVREYDEVTW